MPAKSLSCVTSSSDTTSHYRPFAEKMEKAGIPSIVINIFKCYYTQFLYGAQGKLSERELLPIEHGELPRYEDLREYHDDGCAALSKTVIIKLNGGLGTSMGLTGPKSLLPVRGDKTFLDLILRQAQVIREDFGVRFPQIFMNSFNTEQATLDRIAAFNSGFDNGDSGIPLSFLQHKYPKILASDSSPASWPANPELEWNPPGHGDIYTAMVTSGMLRRLLDSGFRYAFVSNSDNLGAIMDEGLLGYMARENLPFIMEVARRTPSDRKGGHLTRLLKTGRYALRETAQCPGNEMDTFCDIERHRFFNTNSIWVDLEVLEKVFAAHRMMPLDLIVNPKNLDPRDPASPEIYQLETAMGSAISAFYDATPVIVPRSRFAPVKTSNDLLLTMSDCYLETEDATLVPNPECSNPLPLVNLDSKFYKKIDEFQKRFPEGVPSLLECRSLTVKGDVTFEPGVILRGEVRVENTSKSPVVLPAGTEVEGYVEL